MDEESNRWYRSVFLDFCAVQKTVSIVIATLVLIQWLSSEIYEKFKVTVDLETDKFKGGLSHGMFPEDSSDSETDGKVPLKPPRSPRKTPRVFDGEQRTVKPFKSLKKYENLTKPRQHKRKAATLDYSHDSEYEIFYFIRIHTQRIAVWLGLDMGKGFSQFGLSRLLYPIMGWAGSIVVAPLRLILGVAWGPSWFQSFSDSTFGSLRVPKKISETDISALLHILQIPRHRGDLSVDQGSAIINQTPALI